MTERETLKSVHDLKTWPPYFAAVLDGRKTFEIRENDRGFQVGDILRLREWDPAPSEYTGREMMRVVSYVMAGGLFGLDRRCVVMGLASPPAGPVVWIGRVEETQRLYLYPFEADGGLDADLGIEITGSVDDDFLQPGECKRVRLVPLEGNDGR